MSSLRNDIRGWFRILAGLSFLAVFLAVPTGDAKAQATTTSRNAGDSATARVWKDNPWGIKVTRWPQESEIRPTTYAEWKSRQTTPVAPFSISRADQRASAGPDKESRTVCIVVNSILYPDIRQAMDQYISDLAKDGFQVEVYTSSGGTGPQLRTFLAGRHAEGAAGAVLIGDLPVVWYETVCWEYYEQEEFPCDLFYMDLDGTWQDTDNDGLYDRHSGSMTPDIWIGRLTAAPLTMTGKTEAELLQNYFRKNHLYRTGSMSVADRGLIYIDDDWCGDSTWMDYIVNWVYPNHTVIADPLTTVAPDYKARLAQSYEHVNIFVHSDPLGHSFKIPPGVWHTSLGVGEMVTMDPPAAFYNLFACSNARFVETNYMGGWYVFCPDYGLAAVGSTKTGSMLAFDKFYWPLASGRTYGEAFYNWFAGVIKDGVDDWEYCWYYGMTVLGDPTLMPHLSSAPRIAARDVSDAVFGDGDGQFEPGETIQCRVTVTNSGAKPARGVSIMLTTDDAILTISNGEIDLGDLAAGASVDNNGNPFAFTIPTEIVARIDSFYLIMSWNEGAGIDTLAFEMPVGRIPILIVDDDAGGNRERFYKEYLDKNRIAYYVWTCPPSPTATDLAGYDIVIWFVGDYRAAPLSADRIAALKGYMDGGGQLLLTGQAIACQLATLDPAFLADYLKSQYLTTLNIPILAAQPGAHLFDLPDSAVIAGYGGAGNQNKQDHITAVNGGIQELKYHNNPGMGCVSWWDSYKLIFMSFGFEAVINGDPRWIYRDTVYDRILNAFNCPRPGARLTVTVSPGAAMNLTDHTPTIAWHYTGGEPQTQTMYHVQVGADNDWTSAEMWDQGPITAADTAVAYAGTSLVDGVRYYIRVRVHDGADWSNWHYRQIRMNTPPSQTTGLAPDDLQTIPADMVNLAHHPLVDADGNMITYTYEIYDDAQLANLVAQTAHISGGVGDTIACWRVTPPLEVDKTFYWRVQADDGHETGPWGGPASFQTIASGSIRGDANSDGNIDVGDAVFIINFVFKGGESPTPPLVADANCDGSVNVGDAVYIVNYVFKGGEPPC